VTAILEGWLGRREYGLLGERKRGDITHNAMEKKRCQSQGLNVSPTCPITPLPFTVSRVPERL